MFKLRPYIFTSFKFFCIVKNRMGLKVRSNLGLPERKSKSAYIGQFLVNHTKSTKYRARSAVLVKKLSFFCVSFLDFV